MSRDVVQLNCSCCREVVRAPADQGWHWRNAPCLSLRCEGRYQEAENAVTWHWDNMDIARVQGAEHTGLLSREDREATEQSFYRGNQPWNINLLSATPTLEMGIDVGDLSTVLLLFLFHPRRLITYSVLVVPGVKTAMRLTLRWLRGNPHDQFFFEQPLEMMQGQVQAPGVFLNATAILERQLAAFCMDNWVKTGVPASAISKNVKQMLDELEFGHKSGFPYNFLRYVDQHHVYIAQQFSSIFPDLTEDTRLQLLSYLQGAPGQRSLVQPYRRSIKTAGGGSQIVAFPD
ncbi:Helicase Type III restriction [Salmonella enterica subsp. enterica]|uniref:Helicase Type III restriction n=1 Tax=Salmonella enterica I TaxID=59201 RepID=A0A379VX66_SALET|nr:Helicase Type III restriction [Salmonella enterica subsp. enterica]